MADLKPEFPHEAGQEEEIPSKMQIEGARILADQARSRLRERGFDDDEVDRWALTYVAEERSGDVESFVAWIADVERRGSSEPPTGERS